MLQVIDRAQVTPGDRVNLNSNHDDSDLGAVTLARPLAFPLSLGSGILEFTWRLFWGLRNPNSDGAWTTGRAFTPAFRVNAQRGVLDPEHR